MNRVRLDSYVEGDDGVAEIPDDLARQVAALPERALDGLTVCVERGLFIFEMPLSPNRILIACDAKPPHDVRSVGLTTSKQHDVRDISIDVLPDGPRTAMNTIHARAEALATRAQTKSAMGQPKNNGRAVARATQVGAPDSTRDPFLRRFGKYL